jgi:hypothetical protein
MPKRLEFRPDIPIYRSYNHTDVLEVIQVDVHFCDLLPGHKFAGCTVDSLTGELECPVVFAF